MPVEKVATGIIYKRIFYRVNFVALKPGGVCYSLIIGENATIGGHEVSFFRALNSSTFST